MEESALRSLGGARAIPSAAHPHGARARDTRVYTRAILGDKRRCEDKKERTIYSHLYRRSENGKRGGTNSRGSQERRMEGNGNRGVGAIKNSKSAFHNLDAPAGGLAPRPRRLPPPRLLCPRHQHSSPA